MGKPSDYPRFKELYEEWNQKLADSGFEDIEEPRRGGPQLKKTGTMGRFERMPTVVREARSKYYDIIGDKILETTFDDDTEKQILCWYFEGCTQAEIRRRLDPPLHRFTIYKKITKWLKRWGIK